MRAGAMAQSARGAAPRGCGRDDDRSGAAVAPARRRRRVPRASRPSRTAPRRRSRRRRARRWWCGRRRAGRGTGRARAPRAATSSSRRSRARAQAWIAEATVVGHPGARGLRARPPEPVALDASSLEAAGRGRQGRAHRRPRDAERPTGVDRGAREATLASAMVQNPLVLAGRTFESRLIVGTGKYRDVAETERAIDASGAEIVTVALRRVDLDDRSSGSLMALLARKKWLILPNTAGLLHGRRGRAHPPPRARAGDRLAAHTGPCGPDGEARGHRRPADALSRQRADARGGEAARQGGVRRAALLLRRPHPLQEAGGRRVRGRHAARGANRERPGHPQPAEPRDHPGAERRSPSSSTPAWGRPATRPSPWRSGATGCS